MDYFVFTVFDSCSAVYDRPFIARSQGDAVRSFGDIAGDADHPIGKHPEHFSLYCIGTYCDNDAMLVPMDRKCIATAQELVAAKRNIVPGSLQDGNGVGCQYTSEDIAAFNGVESSDAS